MDVDAPDQENVRGFGESQGIVGENSCHENLPKAR